MSLNTRLSDLITAIGTDYKQIRTWLTGSTSGTLDSLNTTNKASLVGAVNELNSKVPVASSTSAAGLVELATLAEVATGTDSTRAVTPAGVRQERAALKAEILGTNVPAALDTLDELAAAIGDNADFMGTMTTALGNRVRTDINTQGLTAQQQANARTNIAAVGTADIGNPDADLVALYTTAKA